MSLVQGKRVSWVELYLDLVFVLAVGRLAHLLEEDPAFGRVWETLGLFFALWWTWIGFAVLYNRHGGDGASERLLFLAGSVPAGVAAVAIEPASVGDSTVFALALAAVRVVLAVAHGLRGGRQVSRAYAVSAALLVGSLWIGEPWRYVLWAVAIVSESGALLRDDREAMKVARREHDLSALAPADPADRLDAHHFAERFGLFLIILLGEVVVSAGHLSVDGHSAGVAEWGGVVAGMILAGGLWWVYFDAAAEINFRVLDLSGGSPSMARALFAVGHMVPAFALILIAAGVALLLEGAPPPAAYALTSIGLGMYLGGTRVFMAARSRLGGVLRLLLLIATFSLSRLHEVLSPHEYIWLLAGWTAMCAGLTRLGDPSELLNRGRPRGV